MQALRLTFLSHTAMGGPFVVGSHQLAAGLAQLGHSVCHVSAPLSLGHLLWAVRDAHVRMRWRRWFGGGHWVGKVHEKVPLTLLPWAAMRSTAAGRRAYSRFMLAGPVTGSGGLSLAAADCVIVDEPRFAGLVCRQRRPAIIYRATDLYAQLRNDPSILEAEKLVCDRADLLIATSVPVAEHLQRLSGRPVTVMTNGVDFEHFAATPSAQSAALALPGDRNTRAIYVGAFDDRFGAAAFRRAALELPAVTFILAGPGSQARAKSLGLSNVFAVGPVPYEHLPALLRQCSVGLLPLSPTPANAGRSPMKLCEYAAADLIVAATTTPEIRGRRLPGVMLAESEELFPQAVRAAFAGAADANLIAAGRECARGESWLGKSRQLAQLAQQACDLRVAGKGRDGSLAAHRAISRESDSVTLG
jgi:hypothetical protein